ARCPGVTAAPLFGANDVHLDAGDAWLATQHRPDVGRELVQHLRFIRAGAQVDPHRAALDGNVAHHTEPDDVAPEVREQDGAERLAHTLRRPLRHWPDTIRTL